MKRTSLGILAGLAAAAFAATRLEPSAASGVIGGYAAGVLVTSLASASLARAARERPARLISVSALGMLLELAVLLGGTLLLRFVPGLARLADWRAFALAFAVAAGVGLLLGALDAAELLGRRSGQRARAGEGAVL